jgi:hypothetical protein
MDGLQHQVWNLKAGLDVAGEHASNLKLQMLTGMHISSWNAGLCSVMIVTIAIGGRID